MYSFLYQMVSKKESVLCGEETAEEDLSVVKSLSGCPECIMFNSN